MRILIDASAAGSGGLARVSAGILAAWPTGDNAASDELHVVASSRFLELASGELGHCHTYVFEPGLFGRLRAQYLLVRSVANSVMPDAILATLPIVPVGPVPCPIVIISHDLRHELRPSEFGRIRRLVRAIEYRRAYRHASRIIVISQRTAADLTRRYPSLASKVVVVPLGSDHLRLYSRKSSAQPGLALAYAHHPNKRPELAIRAWALLHGTVTDLPTLCVIGANQRRARELQNLCESLGVPRRLVTIRGPLDEPAYREALEASRLLMLPSSFEGFGLPVLEALRNRIPVVITPDPALVEVGGGHVTVAEDDSAGALARAVSSALVRDTDARREAGANWAARFTWRSTVSAIRKILNAAT